MAVIRRQFEQPSDRAKTEQTQAWQQIKFLDWASKNKHAPFRYTVLCLSTLLPGKIVSSLNHESKYLTLTARS
jgi:hypothetical protein